MMTSTQTQAVVLTTINQYFKATGKVVTSFAISNTDTALVITINGEVFEVELTVAELTNPQRLWRIVKTAYLAGGTKQVTTETPLVKPSLAQKPKAEPSQAKVVKMPPAALQLRDGVLTFESRLTEEEKFQAYKATDPKPTPDLFC